MDGLFYFLLSVVFSEMLAVPHIHQLKVRKGQFQKKPSSFSKQPV
jgi:hypothetical protein